MLFLPLSSLLSYYYHYHYYISSSSLVWIIIIIIIIILITTILVSIIKKYHANSSYFIIRSLEENKTAYKSSMTADSCSSVLAIFLLIVAKEMKESSEKNYFLSENKCLLRFLVIALPTRQRSVTGEVTELHRYCWSKVRVWNHHR